ncbi:MAG: hypothetical protein U1D35_16500, partial [Paracoccaceae bacterium]|nr:hypothetical protein [Paracoccaceae bacterium]
MRLAAFAPLALIAACGLPMDPVPLEASLSRDALRVALSDGTICRAPLTAVRLDPCGPGYDVALTLEEKPNILRQMFAAAFAALGAEGVLAPMGELVLTDAGGRRFTFVS